MSGLTLSTAGSSTTFSVAAGQAIDSTNTAALALASSTSKTTGAFTVGTGNGALDTGTVAANTWYHAWLISTAGGVVDVLVSLSSSSPTMPGTYTLKRRIGSMKTNASSQWVKFTQIGDEFLWDAAVADVSNSTTLTTSNTTYTLSVPTGLSVLAFVRIAYTNTSAVNALVSSPLTTTQLAGTPGGNSNVFATAGGWQDTETRIWTNTSAQVNASAASASGSTIYINTYGWSDRRGRDT
jgi:hypothetical protein